VEGGQKVYSILQTELERLDNVDITPEKVFVANDEGELIPVMELYSEEAGRIIESIKKSRSKTLSFVSVWQQSQVELAKYLSGSSLKVLLYLISKMKYENLVFDVTQRLISEELGMSSRTVIRSLQELEEVGVIAHTNKKNGRIYRINPAYACKGSFMKIRYAMSIFREAMKQYPKIWKKK
jgi:biotin operon repressor